MVIGSTRSYFWQNCDVRSSASSINPGRRRLSHPNPADHPRRLIRGDPVRIDRGDTPSSSSRSMCRSTSTVSLVSRVTSPPAAGVHPQRLDERILSQLAVLVADRAAPLDDPCHPVAIAITATGQPNPVTEVLAPELAVRADPQCRPTRCPSLSVTSKIPNATRLLVIRALMTPSIAALFGRWFWCPQNVRTRPAPARRWGRWSCSSPTSASANEVG